MSSEAPTPANSGPKCFKNLEEWQKKTVIGAGAVVAVLLGAVIVKKAHGKKEVAVPIVEVKSKGKFLDIFNR